MDIPSDIMNAWLQCGIRVRGAWWKDRFQKKRFGLNNNWILLVIREGSMTISLPELRISLEEQDAILLPPGRAYPVEISKTWQVLDIRFSVIHSLESKNPFRMMNLPVSVPGPWPEEIWQLPTRMNKVRYGDNWKNPEAAWQARHGVDNLLRQYVSKAFSLGIAARTNRPPEWLQHALQAVERRFSDPEFSVEDFAILAGCSPVHLNRCFQISEGKTTSQVLRHLRIKRASHMIRSDPGVDSSEIVRRCGFTSTRQFRQQWKKETGIGLREFRERLH